MVGDAVGSHRLRDLFDLLKYGVLNGRSLSTPVRSRVDSRRQFRKSARKSVPLNVRLRNSTLEVGASKASLVCGCVPDFRNSVSASATCSSVSMSQIPLRMFWAGDTLGAESIPILRFFLE